ncbi:MAG: class I SAM-dependent methyltransferase [Pseudolysinimonas sp.]
MPDDSGTFSATLSAASYWMPTHYAITAWAEHAPFASWLIDAARPRTVLELGTHNGFSFFAMAEAARRLGLPTILTAIDSWLGDDQAGFYSEEVFGEVTAIAERDYPGVTRLIRAYFADAAEQIDDGSVDLLHIDGRHGYDDVLADFEGYRSKLSERGVVIFHDTHEFQPTFGVHRLWEELAPTAPSFEFHHGHGLGVLAVGAKVPARVLDFLAEANRDPESVRETYHRLGVEVAMRAEVPVLRQLVADLQAELDARPSSPASSQPALEAANASLAAEVRKLKWESAQLSAVVDDYRSSTSWRVTAPLRRLSSTVGSLRGRRAAARPSRQNRAS